MFTHPRSELRWSNLSYKNPPIRSIVSSSLSDDLFSRCFCIMNVISASSRVQFMSWVNDPVASMGPRPYSQWSNNFNGPSMTPLLGGFSSPFFFWTEQIQINEFWLQVKSLASSSNPQGFSPLKSTAESMIHLELQQTHDPSLVPGPGAIQYNMIQQTNSLTESESMTQLELQHSMLKFKGFHGLQRTPARWKELILKNIVHYE